MTFKEKYSFLLKESQSEPWRASQKSYIEKCCKNCGGQKYFAKAIGSSPKMVREWRDGKKMKATTALHIEKEVNAYIKLKGKSRWRCDRERLIPWFFEA